MICSLLYCGEHAYLVLMYFSAAQEVLIAEGLA